MRSLFHRYICQPPLIHSWLTCDSTTWAPFRIASYASNLAKRQALIDRALALQSKAHASFSIFSLRTRNAKESLVYQLPDDIFFLIFLECMRGSFTTCPESLAAVSYRWRNIVHGKIGERLWSFINIEIPSQCQHIVTMVQRLARFVSRSKFSNRLALTLCATDLHYESILDSSDISLLKNINSSCLERTVSLRVEATNYFADWLPLGIDGSVPTQMKSLEIEGSEWEFSNRGGDTTANGPLLCVPSPSLKYFKFYLNCNLTSTPQDYSLLLKNLIIHAPRLTHIDIETANDIRAGDIFTTLASFQDLEFLKWTTLSNQSRPEESSFEPSVFSPNAVRSFPKLRTLVLSGTTVIWLFSNPSHRPNSPVFEAPCLTHLHLFGWDPSHSLPQFPSLRELTCLYPTKVTQNVFDLILSNVSTVERATYYIELNLTLWLSTLTDLLRSNVSLINGPLKTLNLFGFMGNKELVNQEREILRHMGSFLIQKNSLMESAQACSLSSISPSFVSSFPSRTNMPSAFKLCLSPSLLAQLQSVGEFVKGHPDTFGIAEQWDEPDLFDPDF